MTHNSQHHAIWARQVLLLLQSLQLFFCSRKFLIFPKFVGTNCIKLQASGFSYIQVHLHKFQQVHLSQTRKVYNGLCKCFGKFDGVWSRKSLGTKERMLNCLLASALEDALSCSISCIASCSWLCNAWAAKSLRTDWLTVIFLQESSLGELWSDCSTLFVIVCFQITSIAGAGSASTSTWPKATGLWNNTFKAMMQMQTLASWWYAVTVAFL